MSKISQAGNRILGFRDKVEDLEKQSKEGENFKVQDGNIQKMQDTVQRPNT